MASVVNFDQNASQGFNIQLDLDGNLNFRANELNGGGPIRLAISDNSGQVYYRWLCLVWCVTQSYRSSLADCGSARAWR